MHRALAKSANASAVMALLDSTLLALSAVEWASRVFVLGSTGCQPVVAGSTAGNIFAYKILR